MLFDNVFVVYLVFGNTIDGVIGGNVFHNMTFFP